MVKKQLSCPVDITTTTTKCWSSKKGLQKTLTAAIIKEYECVGDCDLYVIVTLTDLGPCKINPKQREFAVVIELGCIKVFSSMNHFSKEVDLDIVSNLIEAPKRIKEILNKTTI